MMEPQTGSVGEREAGERKPECWAMWPRGLWRAISRSH